MEAEYIKYLQGLGVDPAQYIRLQADYFRFLAGQVMYRNSSTSLSKSMNTLSKKQESQFNPDSALKVFLTTPEIIKTSLRSPRLSYDDRPIVRSDKTNDDLELQAEEINIQNTGKTVKFEYLRKKSRDSPGRSESKSRNIHAKGEKGHRRTKSVNEFEKKLNVSPEKKIFLKKGSGKLCNSQNPYQVVDRGRELLKVCSSTSKKSVRTDDDLEAAETTEHWNKNIKYRSISSEMSTKSSRPIIGSSSDKQLSLKYSKMVKELEVKLKRLESDVDKFKIAREAQKEEMRRWKKAEKAKIYEEKFSLQKMFKDFATRSEEKIRLIAEVEELRSMLSKQDTDHKKDLLELEESLSMNKKKNDELMLMVEISPKPIKSTRDLKTKISMHRNSSLDLRAPRDRKKNSSTDIPILPIDRMFNSPFVSRIPTIKYSLKVHAPSASKMIHKSLQVLPSKGDSHNTSE